MASTSAHQEDVETPEARNERRAALLLSEWDPDVLPKNGGFVPCEHGQTYYELHGDPTSEQVIVFVHGISWWSFCFEFQVESLVKEGFRVLLFDLYGRGRSDYTDQVGDEVLFSGQLFDVLHGLELLSSTIHLIGFSMGGAIAAEFVSQHDDVVEQLILVASAGTPVNMPLMAQVITLPYLGASLFWAFGQKSMLARLSDEEKDLRAQGFSEEFIDAIMARLRWAISEKPNFCNAIYSSLCKFPLGDMSSAFEVIGQIDMDVNIIWGTDDTVVPVANAEIIKRHIPQAVTHIKDNCGHGIFFQEIEWVHEVILSIVKPNGAFREPATSERSRSRSKSESESESENDIMNAHSDES